MSANVEYWLQIRFQSEPFKSLNIDLPPSNRSSFML